MTLQTMINFYAKQNEKKEEKKNEEKCLFIAMNNNVYLLYILYTFNLYVWQFS